MSRFEDIYARMAQHAPSTLGDYFSAEPALEAAPGVGLWVRPADGRLRCRGVGSADLPGEDGLVLRPTAEVAPLGAAAALLSSRLLGQASRSAQPLESLPWPDIDPLFASQLELLWRRWEAAPDQRQTLVGAFDRIAAELYDLGLEDLMAFERAMT
jgi:hypothetical protein